MTALVRYGSAAGLLAATEQTLLQHEAEHNVVLGLLARMRDHPDPGDAGAVLAAGLDAGDVRLVAVRLPGEPVLVSVAARPGEALDALDPLVEELAVAAPDLPGVEARADVAAGVVARWERATGSAAALAMGERLFELTRVRPPDPPVPGRLRLAGPRDRDLVAQWVVAFVVEAMPGEEPPSRPDRWVDRMLSGEAGALYLWAVDDRVVSMAAARAPTPTGIRVSFVYTPPAERRRGHASALVAAASQDQLDRGRRACFLFTDRTNATSNRIYEAVGYVPVVDVDRYRFHPATLATLAAPAALEATPSPGRGPA